MFTCVRQLTIVGRNRYELYLSFVIVFIGFCYSAVRPQSFHHMMVSTGSLLFGLVCAINAVSDHKRMYSFERILAATWLIVLICATGWAVWDTATIETFSPQ